MATMIFTQLRLPALGVLLAFVAACTPISRPEGVTAADVPPGASRFATEPTVLIFEAFSDVTARAEAKDIDDYRTIALTSLSAGLATDKLEIVAAEAEAPLKLKLLVRVRRWDPLFGGAVMMRANVSNAAGKELFSTEIVEVLNALNGFDSRNATRGASVKIVGGIIDGLKPLRTPAS